MSFMCIAWILSICLDTVFYLGIQCRQFQFRLGARNEKWREKYCILFLNRGTDTEKIEWKLFWHNMHFVLASREIILHIPPSGVITKWRRRRQQRWYTCYLMQFKSNNKRYIERVSTQKKNNSSYFFFVVVDVVIAREIHARSRLKKYVWLAW